MAQGAVKGPAPPLPSIGPDEGPLKTGKEVDQVKATLKQRIVRLMVVVSPVALLSASFAGGRVP